MHALIRRLAVTSNLLFVLWILYNGVNEDFQAKPVEVVSYVALMILLLLNAFLLSRSRD